MSLPRQKQAVANTNTGLYVKSPDGLRLRWRRVQRLVRKMQIAMPWVSPVDLPAMRAWAEMEILGSNIFAELHLNGVTTSSGEPRRLLGELRMLRTAQLAYERDLGMTPSARMSLRVGSARAQALSVVEPVDEAEAIALEQRLLGRLIGPANE
jgi:hypothetical protein